MLNSSSVPFFNQIDFSSRERIIVAVSGGGDSLALLFLLHDYLTAKGEDPAKLLAVTVDHDLRDASASEASYVAELCLAHGIAHRTLRWLDEKPLKGISVAARNARYALLAQAADDAGSDIVLIAHTAEDQAETVAMRLARRDGPGAAGMAAVSLYDQRIWLLRPILNLRRADLRHYLDQRALRYIDDPSNDNLAYERVRVRKGMSETDLQKLLEKARRAAAKRKAVGQAVAPLFAQHLRRVSPGLYAFPVQLLRDIEPEISNHFLRMVLAACGGMPNQLDMNRIAKVRDGLLDGVARATRSRTLVTLHSETVYLHRENRGLVALAAMPGIVWDGRWRILSAGAGNEAETLQNYWIAAAGPLAQDLLRSGEVATAENVPQGLVKAALSTEPAIWKDGAFSGLLAAQCKDVVAEPVLAPWIRLIPGFDLEPVSALAAIFGAQNAKPRSWNRHANATNYADVEMK